MKTPQKILIALSLITMGMLVHTIVWAGDSPTISQNTIQIEAENNGVPTDEYIVVSIRDANNKPEFELTQEEMELIARMVRAEAGNQDQVGKRLVVDVILNRVCDDKFSDTVGGVVYQAGQFTKPAGYYMESDMEAVIEECERRIDTEILWFRSDSFHTFGTPAYQHGAHYFSKR